MNAEEQLITAVEQSAGSPRLILLTGPRGSGKSYLLGRVAERFAQSVANLGVEASERLLPLSERNRRLQLRRELQAIAGSNAILFLDNLEILLEPTLKADPYGCLDELARDRTVVAVWPAIVAPIAPATTFIRIEERS